MYTDYFLYIYFIFSYFNIIEMFELNVQVCPLACAE